MTERKDRQQQQAYKKEPCTMLFTSSLYEFRMIFMMMMMMMMGFLFINIFQMGGENFLITNSQKQQQTVFLIIKCLSWLKEFIYIPIWMSQ